MNDTAEIQASSDFLEKIRMIPLSSLEKNPWNPNHMDSKDLERMTKRFKRNGKVDKPVTARPLADGRYQIIDGEQTCSAAASAGFVEVPVMIEELDDINAIATTFVKNLHGSMNWLQVGNNILKMKELSAQTGEELKNVEIARMMGKTEGAIRNYLLYPEFSQTLAALPSREGLPSDEEIGAMGSDKLRDVMKEYKASLERTDVVETKAAKEEPSREVLEANAYAAALAAMKALTPAQRTVFAKALAKAIKADKEAEKAAAPDEAPSQEEAA
jgi:ParB/RepB/Spo0J family partition protein